MVVKNSFDTTDSVSVVVGQWEVCCALCRLRGDCITWAATMGTNATCWLMKSIGQMISNSAFGGNIITGQVYRCYTPMVLLSASVHVPIHE
jgi:hypothetical protein